MNMNFEKAEGLLSMAQRAGKVASGDFAVRQSLVRGDVQCLLVASDAAEKVRTEYAALAEKHRVPLFVCATKNELGHTLGKEVRAVAALLDKGFRDALEKRLRCMM